MYVCTHTERVCVRLCAVLPAAKPNKEVQMILDAAENVRHTHTRTDLTTPASAATHRRPLNMPSKYRRSPSYCSLQGVDVVNMFNSLINGDAFKVRACACVRAHT
jgi:hypothetical protein